MLLKPLVCGTLSWQPQRTIHHVCQPLGGGGLHQGLWEREEQGWASILWACFPWAKAGGRACAAAPLPPEGRELNHSPPPPYPPRTGLSACERPGLVGEALGLREEKSPVRLTTVPSLEPWKGVLGLWPGGGRASNLEALGDGGRTGREGSPEGQASVIPNNLFSTHLQAQSLPPQAKYVLLTSTNAPLDHSQTQVFSFC